MGVDVYALDFVQINKAIYAMYVTELSDEGACYSCVPGDAGVAAAALGAIESVAALGASESSVAGASESSASAEALHTFTLDSGASRCFFRDCTTLTPLAALVAVSLADPTGGPVVARASTVLLCPAVPSGSLSGLHLPTLSTNLVSNAALHDVWVAESGQVTASSQVSASGQLAVPCSCWVLSHQTLLWHHRLDHPSLPRLRSMHSRLLVSGLPRSLPSLLRLPAPPCLPCVEGRQRAAPHSSEFPLTTAPLQTLHMDVWGPAPVGGMDQERYFLLVVDDYTRYTNVVPLRRKADVIGVLIPWIRATIRQLRDRFSRDLPLLRLHSDRGGEFSSNLLADFCRDEGIVQSFTLLASPQQNGIADRCIGLILEVARTSIIHAAAPHYLWPFVVRYAAHQLNLWPCVSLPETSPTLRWTGQVPIDGDSPHEWDFAAAYHLDYRASLVSDPGPACPPSVGGEVALGCDVLKDRHEELDCLAAAAPHLATMLLAHEGDPNALDIPTPRSYKEANSGEYSSQWQIAMDAEMASWTSTGTYVDEDPPPGVNIISGMWIFRVKRLPGSPPAFKARYVARGFNHPHEEIWLRHPPGFTRSFPEGTQWSLLRPVYGLRQAPREWHDTLRTTLAALWFAPSSANLSLFLRTDTTLSPFFVLVYVDDLVFATADTEALALVKAELQERHTCTGLGELRSYLGLQITRDRAWHHHPDSVTHGAPDPSALRLPVVLATAHSSVYRPLTLSSTFGRVRRAECTLGMRLVLGGRGSVVLTGYYDASWADDQATQRSSQGNTFSLGSGSISWRSTHSSFVLGSSCEAEIYAGAMVAQELRWLTYMLTDVGERPRSPPVLYVHNKAMLALCHEQRLEHRTNHIALHYFLVRELQQRRQLCLSYVASRANTADVFTKAFGSGDHQRFCTALGLVPTLPHLLVA
ncbi:unnamed protein product [Closterium sp. NIES-54]